MLVWEWLYDTLWEMGLLSNVGAATGGSTTTVVDSTLSLDTDVKAGGSIIIQKTTDGLAPQGEIKRVASNTANTYTTAAFSAAVESGDEYSYVSKDFNVYELLKACNKALRKVGLIGLVDTSITTAASQREYTLPLTVKQGKIAGIYIQREANDSDDNQWVPVYDWSLGMAAATSTGLLIFKKQYDAGYKIKIEYLGLHPTLSAFSDTLHESIHPELASAALKYQFNQSRNEEAIASQDGYRDLYGASRDELSEARRMYPVWKPDVLVPALTFKRS